MSASTSNTRGPVAAVTGGVIRAMLDSAIKHGYGPRERHAATVLGIYADPSSVTAGELEHDGVPVSVAPCGSALAVREALLAHSPDRWLVVVTDRPEEDLGAGLLRHFVGQQLRAPNAWEAVRQRFAATGVEAALHAGSRNAELAQGLLAALPEHDWPPAPVGVLTRDHALGYVARVCLGVRSSGVDLVAVFEWTTRPDTSTRLAELRAGAGDDVTDATINWICGRAGAAGALIEGLVRRGEGGDALPLGVVHSVLTQASSGGVDADARAAELALAYLAHIWRGHPSHHSLESLGAGASQLTTELLRGKQTRPLAVQVLTRADALLADAGGSSLAYLSDLLPSGLTARLHLLADSLQRDAKHGTGATAIEEAWLAVTVHQLAQAGTAEKDMRIAPFHAAVRLSRWLRQSDSAGDGSLAALARRHNHSDAWVDAAVNDAAVGVDDPELGVGLNLVLERVQERRDAHDLAFATALAHATYDDLGADPGQPVDSADSVWLLERALPDLVIPLARTTPTLLLILDGMSAGVATEVIDNVLDRGDGWNEALLPGTHARGTALAVLPSLTEVSRTSLLSGRLATGQQGDERRGYEELTTAHGLARAALFHKKPLDESRLGYALADDVAEAIADTDRPLVTCVLNTIDDALDRSDPGGTSWTVDTVKHLRPLLDRALSEGRTVVITADHGHVVERRHGVQRHYPDISSGRSRSADPAAGEGELLVRGRRVLKHDGASVMPWNERLRYGPLKAGYHGGASPAEVVVPVIVLVAGDPPEGSELTLAQPQAPTWWQSPPAWSWSAPAESAATSIPPAGAVFSQEPDLFGGTLQSRTTAPPLQQPSGPGRAVVKSRTFRAQREVAGRTSLTDDQVAAVIDALHGAEGNRLAATPLATALSIPETRVRGAAAQLQKLLNVEGYAVIRTEGPIVILDTPLLREQFEVRG